MTCEKDWIDIFSALLTPTIAVLGITEHQQEMDSLNFTDNDIDKRIDLYKEQLLLREISIIY